MEASVLSPIVRENESSYGNIKIRTAGELVPVAELELGQNESVFFEHHIFLWKDPSVTITAKVTKGAGRRMLAGLPIYMTEAHGPGRIAFSRDGPGQIFFIELKPGMQVHVREHQFLFSTSAVNYTYFRVKGISNMLFGGSGIFIDSFDGTGLLALHGYGNVFTKTLGNGETIDLEPGGFLYKDASVQMSTNSMGIKTGMLGGFTMWMNRFTGPGRIGIQSMTFHLATGE